MSRTLALASLRKDASPDLWTAKAPPLDFGREKFRFKLFRTGRKLPAVNIDLLVERADWGRAGSTRTGQISFRRPLDHASAAMVAKGDEVRCEIAVWGADGGWRTLWQLAVNTPTHDIVEGALSMALGPPADPLKSERDWKFRKDRASPRGWTAAQITRVVCQRLGVKILGQLPTCSHRYDRFVERSKSGRKVIERAWKAERDATGHRFDMDLSTGELRITELREPKYMLLLGPVITAATVEQGLGSFATVMVATSSRKAGTNTKARKLRVEVEDAARRRRWGRVEKTVRAPSKIDTVAELRKWARQKLARTYLPRTAITISHPGLPLLDRGDAVRLKLPTADLHVIVFVTEVRHAISAGSYTMDVTLGFADPIAAARRAATKRKKAAAAARRKRAAKTADAAQAPKPKRAHTRED